MGIVPNTMQYMHSIGEAMCERPVDVDFIRDTCNIAAADNSLAILAADIDNTTR